jgi:hypothetical protein
MLLGILALAAAAPTVEAAPYSVIQTAKTGGNGGFDYVYADVAGRRLYVPRLAAAGQTTDLIRPLSSPHIDVFNLDTLAPVGSLPGYGAHGAVVDPKTHHGFATSKPVVMWDSQTLTPIKSIDVQGGPDGILFDPFNQHVYILSHSAPNMTVIDTVDGTVVGTIDLGAAPEQAATDGRGHVYVDLEDKGQVAVIDASTMAVTAHYDLGAADLTPAGLALDAKNHILFAACRNPASMVILRHRQDSRHPAHWRGRGRRHLQSRNHGNLHITGRRHAHHREREQPHQLRGGTDGADKSGRENPDPGQQDRAHHPDHGGFRAAARIGIGGASRRAHTARPDAAGVLLAYCGGEIAASAPGSSVPAGSTAGAMSARSGLSAHTSPAVSRGR